MGKLFKYLLLFAILINAQAVAQPVHLTSGVRFVLYTPPAGPPTSNLWAYYEFDDAATITHTANNVTAVADKSGNGHTLSLPGSGVINPVWNGTNMITFNAGATFPAILEATTATLTQPFTIYIVGQISMGTFLNSHFWGDNGGNYIGYSARGAGSTATVDLLAVGSISSTSSVAQNTTTLLKWLANNASSEVGFNNTATSGSISYSTALSHLKIGQVGNSGATIDAKMFAIYIYQNGTAPDALLKTYTTGKWGVP